mmetsp:Transcript_13575/g.30327  ORF Transcript_13575/g.30327 Transcript_13575/m.30327 type:complete len:103 (-) Transcript_13575:45-353(-)
MRGLAAKKGAVVFAWRANRSEEQKHLEGEGIVFWSLCGRRAFGRSKRKQNRTPRSSRIENESDRIATKAFLRLRGPGSISSGRVALGHTRRFLESKHRTTYK